MDLQGSFRWLKTSGVAIVGGGIATTVAAMMDPTKYHFPHDLFSGKLWPYFFAGVGMTFGALLIHSPLGQKVMTTYKESQAQLEADKKTIEDLKAQLKPPTGPPAEKP